MIPSAIGTTAEAYSGVLQQLPMPSLKIQNLLCTQTTQRLSGDFLMNSEGKTTVHTKPESSIYKTDYHIQSMTPNRQYASPASNFKPTRHFASYKIPYPWNHTNDTYSLTS